MVSAAALLLLAAGCGGASESHRPAGGALPRTLAQSWAGQASEIASLARAGNTCAARQAASSLRDEIVAKQSDLPVRLSSPLLAGVNALADRLVCQAPPETVTVAPQPPAKPPKPHDDRHGRHKHGKGDGGEG
jgi:hypothetical protein